MPAITVQEIQRLIPKLSSKTGERLVKGIMHLAALGLISWKVRLLRLCGEVFNKRGKDIRIGIGELVTPDMQSRCTTPEELGGLLRRRVYEMPLPETFVRLSEL